MLFMIASYCLIEMKYLTFIVVYCLLSKNWRNIMRTDIDQLWLKILRHLRIWSNIWMLQKKFTVFSKTDFEEIMMSRCRTHDGPRKKTTVTKINAKLNIFNVFSQQDFFLLHSKMKYETIFCQHIFILTSNRVV